MKNSKRGMTLTELVVAMCITVIVVGGAVALISSISDSYGKGVNQAQSHQEAVLAETWLRDTMDTANKASFDTAPAADGVSFYFEDGTLLRSTNGEGTAAHLSSIASVAISFSESLNGLSENEKIKMDYTITAVDGYQIQGGMILNNLRADQLAGPLPLTNTLEAEAALLCLNVGFPSF